MSALKRMVVGRRLANAQLQETLLPKRIALPVFASDALSSVAYIFVADYITAYQGVLGAYRAAYQTGGHSAQYAVSNNLSVMIAHSPHVGYAFKDLDKDGTPSIVQRATILPPQGSIGTISDSLRETFITTSPFEDKYAEAYDRESAYEILAARYMGEGVQQTQVVQPVGEAQAAPAYQPMTFSFYTPQTGAYEVQELPQMQQPLRSYLLRSE